MKKTLIVLLVSAGVVGCANYSASDCNRWSNDPTQECRGGDTH